MRVECVICTDLFHGIHNIISTPCGHVFHEACALQWFEKSRTCPICRKSCQNKQLRKIFFNQSNETFIDTKDNATLQSEVNCLKAQVLEIKAEKFKLKEQLNWATTYSIKKEEEEQNTRTRLYQTQEKLQEVKLQNKTLKDKVANKEELENEVTQLRAKVETLEKVRLLVDGLSNDVENVMSSYSNNSEGLRQLATFNTILTQQLKASKNEKRLLQRDISNLMRDKSGLNAQVTELTKCLVTLREEKQHLIELCDKLEHEKSQPSSACSCASEKKAGRVFARTKLLESEKDSITSKELPECDMNEQDIVLNSPQATKRIKYVMPTESPAIDSPSILPEFAVFPTTRQPLREVLNKAPKYAKFRFSSSALSRPMTSSRLQPTFNVNNDDDDVQIVRTVSHQPKRHCIGSVAQRTASTSLPKPPAQMKLTAFGVKTKPLIK